MKPRRPRNPAPCVGCDLFACVMRGVPDPLGFMVAALTTFAPRLGAAIPDLVVVLGAVGADLPAMGERRGPYLFVVMRRADVIAWAQGNPVREALVAGLSAPLPAGRFWALVATPDFGVVVHHDLVTPTPAMQALAELALVPPDGGPALGARFGKGGAV